MKKKKRKQAKKIDLESVIFILANLSNLTDNKKQKLITLFNKGALK